MEFSRTVAPACENDLSHVMKMIFDLAKFEGMESSVKIDSQQLCEDFKNNKFHCFVCKDKDEIIGFALYVFTFDLDCGKNVYLEDFFVKEKYRNQGVGGEIWDHLIEKCQKEDCSFLEFSVLNWNINAIQFYLNRGAKNCTKIDCREVYRLAI